jgi:FdhD protein
MKETKSYPDSLTEVEAHRIATDGSQKGTVKETCDVAVEGPITIDVNDFGSYTVLCTPDDKRAMAVGFLFSEGIIDKLQDINLLHECKDDTNVIRVSLADTDSLEKKKGRNLLIVSSCGLCGSENMDEKLASLPKVGDTLRISGEHMGQAIRDLSEKQVLFERCGGTHAISIFNANGETIAFAEDIGRHNALDKAIGKCIIKGISTSGCGAAMSGRISFEMVGKCARAGIEVVCAVSAPTSLALKAASSSDITTIAFVRGTRATIFTCPKRILS